MSAGDAAQGLWLLVAVTGLALPVVVAGLPVAGVGAFVAVGAYGVALLGPGGLGWPLGLAAVAAVGLGAVAGLLLARGAARLSGGPLALATWSAGWALDAALRGFPGVTGGDRGLIRASPARLVSPALGTALALTPAWCCVLAGVSLAAAVAAAARLCGGPLGRELAAVRAGAPLAASLGVPVTAVRGVALAVAGGCGALAGAGLMTATGVVAPADVSPLLSLQLLVAVLVVPRAVWWAPLAGGVAVGAGLLGAEQVAALVGADPGRLRGLATALGLAAVLALRRRRRVPPPPVGRAHGEALADPEGGAPPEARGGATLEAAGVRVAFGGLQALAGVDLVLVPGEVHALVGPNGSGKTTLLRVLAGTVPADAGEVRVAGRVLPRGASARLRAGVARTPQPTVLLPGLDARTQAVVAAARSGCRRPPVLAHLLAVPSSAQRERLDAESATAALRRCWLPDAGDPAAWPAGAQRRLQVARALATGARVLLLDEPAAGMSAGERAVLAGVLRDLARDGCAVLLVEHDMGLVRRVADRVTVLAAGMVVAAGTPEQVRDDDEVVRLYLGAGA